MAAPALSQKLHVWPLPSEWEGRRVGEALAEVASALSSRQRVMAVRNGLVSLDGEPVEDLDRLLEPGRHRLELDLRHGIRGEGRPARPRLLDQIKVLHDDGDCVVVSKAAGVLVQPTPTEEPAGGAPPVVELLKHFWKSKGQRAVNPVVVQRLDKETSGVMVLGKNGAAGKVLQKQAAGRTMERHYLAIVHGSPAEDRGTWRSVLGEGDDGLRQKIADSAEELGGRLPHGASEAVTHWRVEERLRGATLLELRLETGRTHQIRVHCAEAGHPVVGDRIYAKLAQKRFPRTGFLLTGAPPVRRLMLHAAKLKFQHPTQPTRWLTFREQLPQLMEDFAAALRDSAPDASTGDSGRTRNTRKTGKAGGGPAIPDRTKRKRTDHAAGKSPSCKTDRKSG